MGMQTSTLPENQQDFMISGYVCPPDGIITSEKQYEWAHNLPKPSRSTLTHSARRYVIRADHLCGWTTVWIGKRNYKMFMLFNFYGTPYLGLFSAYCIRYFVKYFNSLEITPLVIVAIYGILALSFTLLTFSFSISSLSLACHNRTNWEDWNTVTEDYDRGSCKANMEDICGTPASKWDYFCPKSPFTNITNDELVRQYDP
ncbi:DHHC zinc finger domain containing protein [Trichomonas vaginalis G3]|uniref:Palmitoyltransferase n=1 Tax=Trichomonas vaginalis (strain ATCC PRA-98 / G3) TaxID=412133 RepID=A2FN84_TRIV3|nr:DHHC palmitoyltransferase family [Trichomonas vaginalis G3]EAX93643.1 DHHC zinc finger domain containing protein [Trichomonas vaginalis G3]KAI5507090.1 DHHC palmitoyltransferase family [Trichomonas vaginalis G3]|eukprot:XP_001306573.1 DHHC zinc finger domain containing protein [Trichomonas vaginalis G3]